MMDDVKENQLTDANSLASNLLDEKNKFSHGKVVKFFPQTRYGFVKDKHGKDVYFNLEEVRFIGEKDHRDLQEGIEVGYDVGWTSHGLHITKIKIY